MNDNREEVKKIIMRFAGHENIIAVPRVLIEMTDDHALAMMLNQLLYWSSQKEWVYKSLDDWCKEIGHISRRTMNSFAELPYIETKIQKANGVPTTHYRINFELFYKTLIEYLEKNETNIEPNCQNEQKDLPNCVNGNAQMGKSLTEITTQITTINTNDVSSIARADNIPPAQSEKELTYEPCNDDGEPIAQKKKKKLKSGRTEETAELISIANALADVTGMSLALNKGRIFAEAKLLTRDKRVSAELIRIHYGAEGAWYKQDWRGKQGQKPRLSEVRETIFGFGPTAPQQKIIKGDIYSR